MAGTALIDEFAAFYFIGRLLCILISVRLSFDTSIGDWEISYLKPLEYFKPTELNPMQVCFLSKPLFDIIKTYLKFIPWNCPFNSLAALPEFFFHWNLRSFVSIFLQFVLSRTRHT
jgi:hypothetical protein